MSFSLLGMLFGIALGARHALEPDHLAAVSVLVSERPGVRRGAVLGALWGAGHTLALVGVGLVLAVLASRMPARLADTFELGVSVMLVVLGLRAMRRAARDGLAGLNLVHRHSATAHSHPGAAVHVHVGRWTLASRPLLVGVVHGLAGSGALVALAVARLPSTGARALFIVLFGLGSVLGMMVLSGLAGWPLARLARRPIASRALCAATGLLSTGFGIVWGWPLVERILP